MIIIIIILIIILNIKRCISKLSIKMFIKRKQQSKKGLSEFWDVGNLQKTFVTSRETFVCVMKQRGTKSSMSFANIQTCYLLNYSIQLKLATEEGNGRNEIWILKKTRNWSSCTKVAPSVSCTHDLFADDLNSWPDIYIYVCIYVCVYVCASIEVAFFCIISI